MNPVPNITILILQIMELRAASVYPDSAHHFDHPYIPSVAS